MAGGGAAALLEALGVEGPSVGAGMLIRGSQAGYLTTAGTASRVCSWQRGAARHHLLASPPLATATAASSGGRKALKRFLSMAFMYASMGLT